jgi:anaphase-promoting complex subunit 3
LKGSESPENRYLFGLCAFKLNKFREAEVAITESSNHSHVTALKIDKSGKNDPIESVVNGAAGHYLMGLICRYTNIQTTSKSIHIGRK